MRVYFKSSDLLLTTCLLVLLTSCIAGLSLDVKVKLFVTQNTKENESFEDARKHIAMEFRDFSKWEIKTNWPVLQCVQCVPHGTRLVFSIKNCSVFCLHIQFLFFNLHIVVACLVGAGSATIWPWQMRVSLAHLKLKPDSSFTYYSVFHEAGRDICAAT